MKFTIFIPTQDRPHFLAVVVQHAMQLQHSDFEVIVSDNSTTQHYVQLNKNAVSPYVDAANFRIIYPPKVLSPPEHFEFAIKFSTTSEYVVYLTDKMVILPYALSDAESAMDSTNADILNWGFATYFLDDVKNPLGSGTLVKEAAFLKGNASAFNPKKALEFKASGRVPRNKQKTEDYILGKIVFGCYRRSLIDNVFKMTGTLFCGATHDYSAMIQALALAKKGVVLHGSYFIFLSLPANQSLGSLTDINSQAAKKYFHSFSNEDEILSNLLVPMLYSSQHNMVAHDYKKFLPLYGQQGAFNVTNWLSAIYSDLVFDSKEWGSEDEKSAQNDLFINFLEASGKKEIIMLRWKNENQSRRKNKIVLAICARISGVLLRLGIFNSRPYHSLSTNSLFEAIVDIHNSMPLKSIMNINHDSVVTNTQ